MIRGSIPAASPCARRESRGFSLVEILVVIAIIAGLLSLLIPSLSKAKQLAQTSQCLSNLHSLGDGMRMYGNDHHGSFWNTVRFNFPTSLTKTYFWGTATVPVSVQPSWLMKYQDYAAGHLWCPSLSWGTYVPQGGVNEPTTTYGYNAWCLDPAFWGRTDVQGKLMRMKRDTDLKKPADLFVFADSGMYWTPAGVPLFQNSTSLDPPQFPWGSNNTPTTHFRHQDSAATLCADGHAQLFGTEGAALPQPQQKLGFVGTANLPHYDQN